MALIEDALQTGKHFANVHRCCSSILRLADGERLVLQEQLQAWKNRQLGDQADSETPGKLRRAFCEKHAILKL